MQHHNVAIGHMLPALFTLTLHTNDGNTRCLCLKILNDVLALLLPHMTAPATSTIQGTAVGVDDVQREQLPLKASHAMTELLEGTIIPKAILLLDEEGPGPAYVLKLLGAALLWRPELAYTMVADLLQRCVDFFNLTSPNNNKHNLRVLYRSENHE